jgi:hypothetical protein
VKLLRVRFSLKILLFSVTFFCVVLGGLVGFVKHAKHVWEREQRILDRLPQSLNSEYVSTYNQMPALLVPLQSFFDQRYFDRVIRYDGYGDSLNDEDVKLLSELAHMRELLLRKNPGVTDQGISGLSNFSHLEEIDLEYTGVGDQALLSLSNCQYLRYLSLGFTNLTCRNLHLLKRFRYLEYVSLAGTNIDDTCIAAVVECKSIRELNLQDTAITDQGITQLGEMVNLRRLWVDGTGVSKSAKETLRQKIPGLEID